MKVTGNTKIIGFLGSSYKTSKMYDMYNSAFAELDLDYQYVPLIVDDLGKAIEGVKNLGMKALGVTIPYKIDIIPYLDELDENAQRIGAVNVVVNKNGKLIGGNTDGIGALRALKEKTEVKNKKVVILGAGGASRAIAFSLKDNQAVLTILNRDIKKAEELAKALGEDISFGGYEQLKRELEEAHILINTTPVGMINTDTEGQSLVDMELLRPGLVVMELVSKPRETKLVQDAKRRGCEVVYGYRMLLHQGVEKFKMYTDQEPPIEVMERAMEEISGD
ncbi:shikimate dehydrogenase [Candidatus Gracilibacteria bacterium]|nr:shikimate dehydrogenase [Candidatus Gracilibacteria bacterium]